MLFEKIHLEEGEKIIKIVRKHWFILVIRTFYVLVSALLPLLVWWFISYQDANLNSLHINTADYFGHFVYLFALWILYCWIAIVYIWTDYYLDVWTITDRRIIAVEQVSLFNRSTGSFRLERLQDVNIYINGILATLLHYGTIELQTASGSQDEFRTDYMPHPRSLKSTILEATDNRFKVQNQHDQRNT